MLVGTRVDGGNSETFGTCKEQAVSVKTAYTKKAKLSFAKENSERKTRMKDKDRP